VDNGKFVLRPIAPAGAANCIEGTFTDLRRFEAVAVANQPREYTNSRVDIQLQIGLWVSENGALSLKFDPGFEAQSVDNFPSTTFVTGCNASNQAATVKFEGVMQGFNETTLRRPYLEKLTGAGGVPTYFTQVEFVDGATLRLINPQGQLVTLKRQPSPITCPP
jgi:hypothetical protein